jgi:DNA excision repair protein ERCC-4
VDVREFRSALPSILHLNNMRLAPVTLIVGDFVLTNSHCIERKSISDLFGSFASGRLYTQMEAMNKYYTCPCLLIEFDPNKTFALQNQKEIGIEIRYDSICTKMSALTMQFPKLRILWSRSPHDTYRIFHELKQNHDEPNVEQAIEVGKLEAEDDWYQSLTKTTDDDDDDELDDNKEEEDEVNEAARNMLLRLPGVNTSIARKIIQEVDTFHDLCQLSRDELRTIAGPVTGQKLFTFFRQSIHNVIPPPTSSLSSSLSKR